MNKGVRTVLHPVKDVARAKRLYGKLLGEPLMDQPYYVGWRVGDQDIGLDPNGHSQGMTGALAYWHIDDIQKTLGSLLEAGAQSLQGLKMWAGASWSRSSRTRTAT